MLIERTKQGEELSSNDAGLDVYRALVGAGVKLKSDEQFEMARCRPQPRPSPIEAANAWDVLVKAGDPPARKNKALIDTATKAKAAADKATELAKSEAAAADPRFGRTPSPTSPKATWRPATTPKAIELFNKALAKGEMDAGHGRPVKVRLGVAQFKGGKKADAVKTWQSIKADNGAAWLAKSWIAISKC